jgi:hypothetical protein
MSSNNPTLGLCDSLTRKQKSRGGFRKLDEVIQPTREDGDRLRARLQEAEERRT